MNLGLAVKVMMARADTNQTGLSKSIGVTRAFISNVCNNNKTPSFKMLGKIASALNCKVWEILKEAEGD